MEHFYCKTKIISGAGAVSALAELGSKRLLLVTDTVCGMTDSYAKRLYQELKGID